MADPQPKRTIGAKKKIGPKPGAAPKEAPKPAEAAAPEKKKGGKLKKILFGAAAALLLIGIGVGAAVLLLKPAESAVAVVAEETPPEPGLVVPLEDTISINLANGKYLRLGLAIQMPVPDEDAEVEEEGGHGGGAEGPAGPDHSRVRDLAIRQFSGRTMDEVNDPAQREALRVEFVEMLQETFGEDQVMDVYLTDFVTQ